MWLTKLSIKRPVAIWMLFAALTVLGFQGYSRMPAELQPRIDFPWVSVFTIYPGAGPAEVETLISKQVEDAVSSVSGVKNVTSVSQQGVSVVNIEFYLGTDIDVAASDVREKIDTIRRFLPEEAEPPTISKANTSGAPILYMAMRSTAGRTSAELRDIADRVVKDRLGQVPGVAAVFITGGDVREIRVEVDKSRLDAYGLSISEVAQAIRAQNLNVPAGRVTEENRDYAVRVIGEFASVEELRSLRLSFPGRNGAPDRVLTLGDLGTVKDSVAERTETASLAERVPGQENLPPSAGIVSIAIQKTSEGNTVQAAEGVHNQLKELRKILPADLQFTITQDQSEQVKHNLNDVVLTLIIGAFLAVTIVYFFLHNLRGTFIVSLAIPASIIATFLVMYALGFTLNTMTLMGLSLAVGILVDDSIVVLENIYRHLQMGEPPHEAALNGRGEIGLAAVTITLVDVVVFVPVAFMGGIVGQFFRSFGITVAVATLFSLLVSFTLAPMLASRWYQKGEAVEAHGGFFGLINRFYGGLENRYRRALAWALRHRGTVIFAGNMALVLVILWMASAGSGTRMIPIAMGMGLALVIAGLLISLVNVWRNRRLAAHLREEELFGGNGSGNGSGYYPDTRRKPGFAFEPLVTTAIAAIVTFGVVSMAGAIGKPLGFRFAPGQDQSQVALTVELPAGASLAATTRVLDEVERRVSQMKDVKYLETQAGASSAGGFAGGGNTGTQYGQVRMTLQDPINNLDRITFWKDSSDLRHRSDVEITQEVRKIVADIPGATIRTSEVSGFGGAAAPVQIEINGPDMDELLSTSREVQKTLEGIPGVLSPDISFKASKPEVQVIVDRERAAQYGLSVSQVANALRDSIEGNTSAKFREGGEEYDIRVQYEEVDRSSVADVGGIIVGNRGGVPVRIADVAKTIDGRGPTKIDRKNRQRQIVVGAYLAPGKVIGNMQQEIDPKVKPIFAKTKATYRWGGEANTMAEEGKYMFAALGLAVLLVYMLMAALFNNMLYPFIIMLSIPQALVGGLLGLLMANTPLSIIAMIGFIMLMGLVTKNAILLVDYTNTLRSRGYRREDALTEAGPTRLRPILMTTLAQVFGALPIALALGRGSEFRQPLGIVIIGGLLLSTLLTLLVIPCSYTVFDDISGWWGRVIHRRRPDMETLLSEERDEEQRTPQMAG